MYKMNYTLGRIQVFHKIGVLLCHSHSRLRLSWDWDWVWGWVKVEVEIEVEVEMMLNWCLVVVEFRLSWVEVVGGGSQQLLSLIPTTVLVVLLLGLWLLLGCDNKQIFRISLFRVIKRIYFLIGQLFFL